MTSSMCCILLEEKKVHFPKGSAYINFVVLMVSHQVSSLKFL